MEVSGLGPRPLGRILRVSPYRVREWRRGVVPSGRYLFGLLVLAESMGMREMLTSPDPDMPSGRPRECTDAARSSRGWQFLGAEGAAPTARQPSTTAVGL